MYNNAEGLWKRGNGATPPYVDAAGEWLIRSLFRFARRLRQEITRLLTWAIGLLWRVALVGALVALAVWLLYTMLMHTPLSIGDAQVRPAPVSAVSGQGDR